MIATSKLLTCAVAGLILSTGLAIPAFAQKIGAPVASAPAATTTSDVDFGDDSGQWPKDTECDDSRFIGTGMATEMDDSAIAKDATDCSAAFAKGTITLKETSVASNSDIDFGDDSSQWAKDGECDDPRFTGTGAASQLLDEDKLHDATDCKAAFTAGTITLQTDGTDGGDIAVATADIVYGNDTSEYNNDQECDDPRFVGSGVASEPVAENRMHDATDCKAAVAAGTATMKPGETNEANAFDYGTDNSKYANDGECDDKRFVGEGMDKKLLEEDVSNDATDCRTLVESGALSIIPVYDPAYVAGAPYDTKGINFGDNTSEYANDDQCDDPRFQGPGTATSLLDGDLRHDRDDCKAAFAAGTVILID